MNPHKDNEFDRQVREKFEQFSPEVSSGLWEKIAGQLDAQEQPKKIVIVPAKKRLLSGWWISVAAAVLVVCGAVYWYNRPVTVTYLQGREAANNDVPQKPTKVPAVIVREPVDSIPSPEPLDIERLKKLFAKRKRPTKTVEPEPQRLEQTTKMAVSEKPGLEDGMSQSVAATTNSELSTPPINREEPIIAAVPAIQPLVVLDEEEDHMLASTAGEKHPFGLSNILNYMVGTVDQREEKLVKFSNDGEGSLKLDFNFSLAKNRKKRLK